jgi:hypothetical protein
MATMQTIDPAPLTGAQNRSALLRRANRLSTTTVLKGAACKLRCSPVS